MKQIISAIAVAGSVLMASCSTTASNDNDAVVKAQQATIDSMRLEIAKQQVVDSMNEVARVEAEESAAREEALKEEARVAAAQKKTARSTPARRSSTGNYSSYTGAGYSNPSAQPVVYQNAPVETQKKGWSAKAKGAVIGAGTGAVSGAVINRRDRVKGAIIGGVLGAGAGTGVGAVIDKKNGR